MRFTLCCVAIDWGPVDTSVRLLFRDARATPAVPDFLRDTRVRKMPGLALFGVQEDEMGEGIALWPESEAGSGSENEQGGSGPP